jgi:uncharacterized protein YegL
MDNPSGQETTMPITERTRSVINITPAPTFNQLGILVLDGSGSMKESISDGITKAQAVDTAVREIFGRLRRSTKAKNFSLSVVTFDQNAQLHTPVTPATEVDDNGNYDPAENHGGGTNIATGLLEAKRVAGEFLRSAPRGVPTSVVIVLMSDGRDGDGGVGDPEATRHIAEDIKQNPAITICSTYFAGEDARVPQEEENLRFLASNPAKNYRPAYDLESLRNFFFGSLST